VLPSFNLPAELQKSNVQITGAARGLGLLLARRLASEGHNICATDLRFDLDILVNNAGIRRVAPIEGISTQTWDQVHSSNLKAVGLNHFDLDLRAGISGYISLEMPHIMGCEGASVVAEVGSSVTAFKPGQNVLPYLTTSCGHCDRCLSGHDNICLTFDKLGVTRWGTYAEYV